MREAPGAIVDLFCGVGGMTHGFVKEGFRVVAGVDVDTSCRYAYEANNGDAEFVDLDIRDIDASDLRILYGDTRPRILVGCAPCQPFSAYSRGKEANGKWSLLRRFGAFVDELKPEVVSMENVPGLMTFRGGRVYRGFLGVLARNEYHVWARKVFCPDYGVPQSRTRLVLLASRYGTIELVRKTHAPSKYRKVIDVISDLPSISDGERSRDDPLHWARKLSDLNKERIRRTPAGGSWKDWEDRLVLACHKKATGRRYGSIYGRMSWDELAPTMTTHCVGYGNGRFGHPEQDRGISLREAALFQTFPGAYRFIEPGREPSTKALSRHIGNAVPVRLARIVARSIKRHLEQYDVRCA